MYTWSTNIIVLDYHFLFHSSPVHYAQTYAQEVGCVGKEEVLSSDKILERLQKKTAEELANKNGLFETYLFTGNPWIPIVDDYAENPFIPADPKTLLKEGKYNKVNSFVASISYLYTS